MRVFGLTGGIASGKSSAGQYLRSLGFTLIDADQLSRKVQEPGKPAYQALKELWPECFGPDGVLNRKALADIVFSNKFALGILNGIVHPAVAEERDRQFQQAEAAGESVLFYESALLTDSKGMDGLIVVLADPETQLRRLMARNSLTEAEARDRMSAQVPRDLSLATHVIENNGTEEELKRKVRQVADALIGLENPLSRSSAIVAG